jgi:hypothetical protein
MNTMMLRATAAAGGLAIAATFAVGCSQTKEADKAVASSAASASSVISSAETAASSAVAASGDVTTLIYPDEANPMFSVDAPPGWLVTGVGQVGDFGTLESPNGSILQFRAQNYATQAEAEVEAGSIVESTFEFLKENYTDVKLDDPTDTVVQGQPAMELTGTGKDKDGNPVKFLSAVIALGPQSVAEVWAAVLPDGNDDLAAAEAALASFMPLGS